MNANSEFLNRQDCILLLVDIQKTLFDLCVDAERVTANTSALIDAANVLQIPVLFTVQIRKRSAGSFPI